MSWSGGWAVGNWTSGHLQQGPGFGLIFAVTCTSYLLASALIYLFFGGADLTE